MIIQKVPYKVLHSWSSGAVQTGQAEAEGHRQPWHHLYRHSIALSRLEAGGSRAGVDAVCCPMALRFRTSAYMHA